MTNKTQTPAKVEDTSHSAEVTKPCPSCGYCPTCGRQNAGWRWTYPYTYPVYPYVQPYWYSNTTTAQSVRTGTISNYC